MYLKRVEMFGFKSFADRTGIDFGHGVYAIVGPNGCGKSNVVDAVRWVLGEQSPKSVRGTCMEDVIFTGNGHRAAHNFGEVTLTLDNEAGRLPIAFSEVAVTRRVHRGGECEYLINRETVRLRDIHNLFFDTGVSRNLYSLIGQGQVATLASSAPQERRVLFEEAAGIMKYRTKKVIALRNLDATVQDLARLNDILREREAQLETLKRQARRAERAGEVRRQLREAAVARLKADLAGQEEAETQRRYQQEELLQREQALRAERELTTQELAALRARERDCDLTVEQVRAAREQARNRVLQLEGQVSVLAEKVQALDQRQRLLDEAATVNAERLTALALQEEQRGALLATARQTLAAGEEELRTLATREEDLARLRTELESGIGAAERRLRDIDSDVRARAEEEHVLLERLAQKQAADDEQHKRMVKLASHLDTIEFKGLELRQHREQRHAARVEAETVIASLRTREQELLAAEKDLDAKLRAVESLMATDKAQLETLEQWVRNHEGCRDGVRALLAAAAQGETTGVRGLLAERLTIAAEFEVAIEAALGEALQTLLADDEAAAWRAVQLLADGTRGRAALVWPELAPLAADTRLSPPPQGDGIDGPALALLGHKPEDKGVLAVLLGRTCVVRDLDTARALRAAGRGAGWDFVTRRGDVWQADGVLTAGPLESSQLLGRNRVIAELREQLRTRSEELRRLHAQRHTVEQDRGALQSNRIRQQERMERLALEERAFDGDLQAWDREQKGIRQEHGELQQRRAVMAEELRLLAAQVETLAQPDATLAQTRAAQEEALAQLQARRQEVGSELARVRDLHTDRKVAVAAAREQSGALERELADLARQRQAIAAEEEKQRPEREAYGGSRQNLQTQRAALETELHERHAAETISDGELREAVNRQQEVKAQLDVQGRTLAEQQDLLESLQQELHRIDREISDETHREDTLRQAVMVEFQLDDPAVLDAELAACTAEPPAAELLADLRKKHQHLGGADEGAIEEYRLMQERIGADLRQRDDLTQAEANLRATIRRIDRYSREMFRRTFDAVNNNFRILARRLFEGGEAWLELIEDDDLLKAGIEVFVRPPGKKQQAMSLYSGGEKALISLALLFAVFLVKPSPFCILDEVDAPLDDSNAQRFIDLVREFAKRTQFVMITHKKVTMMSADRLIGITMQERGVSKVLEVSIGEAQELAEA